MPKCRECGTDFNRRHAGRANTFCNATCKRTFHNRRMLYGAQLFDLIMCDEIEPGESQRKALRVLRDDLVAALLKANPGKKVHKNPVEIRIAVNQSILKLEASRRDRSG